VRRGGFFVCGDAQCNPRCTQQSCGGAFGYRVSILARRFGELRACISPFKKPPSWSERLAVNFEKDVTLSLFMVRRLAEAGKFSSRMSKHKVELYRSKFVGEHHRLRFGDVGELYRIDDEKRILKGVPFVCNQFIHADFTYAIQGSDRNWAGLFTSSDFEKRKWLYRVPLTEIVKVLELAVSDYPSAIFTRYDREKEDWIVETD